MKRILILIISICFMSGCSSLKVIPEPVQGGEINAKDNSLSITRNNVTVMARSGDMEIVSYNLDGSVASFFVVINNQTDDELTINNNSFLLVDNDGRQYFQLTPEKVKEIIARDTYYLIPYPYVGFYYLEDYEKSSFYNRFTSDRPYFYEVYPQDIYTKALPVGSIIPKAKIAGLVYFRIDLEGKKGVNLEFFRNNSPRSMPADFIFPFKIVK
ncbi:hypothetical protein OR1_03880 [Geobacter sp. OR-1]|uniref:hypothetical protein n=1 Tax=Geobacter sp. OR-1 TaxID=1266765 RepID=UPI0005420129|nr:hypothetical protein [Geobacter sp. OR-1]GAM11564.1 hypothetical protein OR1_03880 [Geobacter sp. OR-1]